jgi:hypothetical protein
MYKGEVNELLYTSLHFPGALRRPRVNVRENPIKVRDSARCIKKLQ